MNKKKGQAAMEFLMTYGWAILAAIIVIAVLAIYFRPGKIAPSVTTIEAPFSALGWSITAGSSENVKLEVKNAGAENLRVYKITLTGDCTGGTTDIFDFTGWTDGYQIVTAGSRMLQAVGDPDADPPIPDDRILDFSCADEPLQSGGTFSADVEIEYKRPGSDIFYLATGTISGSID